MSGTAANAGNSNVVPAAVIVILLLVAVAAGVYLASGPTFTPPSSCASSTLSASSSSVSSRGGSTSTSTSSVASSPPSAGSGKVIKVVAAENFWGSLVSQLGGTHANVTSIVSDPNTDPHEYQSNPSTASVISEAQLVVVNGAGYDTWALNIISASSSPNRMVINVQMLLGKPVNANPHFWYSPYYVNDTVRAMYDDLVAIDPADTAYFHQQYLALNSSLWQSYMSLEIQIKQQFAGVPVASTEDMFVYMANATGLDVVSPTGFMQAVAEGNDPPALDVAFMQELLECGTGTVRVLVFNRQTVTPLTDSVKSLAADHKIPTIGMTETIQPLGTTFQNWMEAELVSLQTALSSPAEGG